MKRAKKAAPPFVSELTSSRSISRELTAVPLDKNGQIITVGSKILNFGELKLVCGLIQKAVMGRVVTLVVIQERATIPNIIDYGVKKIEIDDLSRTYLPAESVTVVP